MLLSRRAFLGSAAAFAAAATPQRPNVLFISVDDLNDWIGCLRGYPGVSTPNIDALARRGVLFANAHCASPLCNPSRTALLTGWAPHRTGIYNNENFWRPSLPDAVSLPEYFRREGYFVAGAGKVFHHTAGNNPPSQWDEFQLQVFDDPWYRRADWYPWNKRVPNPPGHPFNGLRDFAGEFDWGVLPNQTDNDYGDARAVEFGEKILARPHAKPFFLAVGLWHPHIPLFSPQRYFDLYPPDKVKLPETPADDLADIPKTGQEFAAFRRAEFERLQKEGKWKEAVRAYLAAISFADALIGRLLRALDQSAHAKNTVIVFWSDNGWHLGEKQHFHKSTLWQRSTHVPLIFAGAGIKKGPARAQPVSLLDIYPTLIDLCRTTPRRDLDGQSLKPLLDNPKAGRDPIVTTYLPGNHAVRDERWRYIRYHDGGEELYDHSADPNEWKNLAADPQYAARKADLARFIPARSAAPKPERDAFEFDFATYTYRPKAR